MPGSQYCSRPARQLGHVWHESTMQPTATRSPAEKPFTSVPTRVTATSRVTAGTAVELLENVESLDLAALIALWNAHDPERALGTREVYRRLGERILRLGEPLLASDVLVEGLKRHAGDVRLLAAARLGRARLLDNLGAHV